MQKCHSYRKESIIGMSLDRPKPRLADVAKLARVSIGSASRALSMPDAVKPTTLAAVRKAAEKLRYVPDGAARALALGRTATIGVQVPTLANPVYAHFTHAAQQACAARDHRLIVVTDEYDDEQQRRNIRELVEQRVAGLILVGSEHHPDVAQAIAQTQTPHIHTWSFDEARGRGCVGISNRKAASAMVRHLLDLGHRHFAVLSGHTAHNERSRSRLEGIRDALAEAGCELPAKNIIFTAFTINAGRECFARLTERNELPTAILCGTDLLAAGCVAEAKSRGIRVPQQLSVAGFDDVDFASLLDPPLTTVRVPAEAMGIQAVEALLAHIALKQPIVDIELSADLILRGSTGPAPADRIVGPARKR
jgi:LacI family transcriptional regulator